MEPPETRSRGGPQRAKQSLGGPDPMPGGSISADKVLDKASEWPNRASEGWIRLSEAPFQLAGQML